MSESFDVIVVGCGPAGGAAAAAAARHGLRTAVVDKARFPRDKLCGGLFSGRSRTYFREAFGADIDLSIFLVSREIEYWARGRTLARRTNCPPMYLTMRRDLDRSILDLALRAGAQDFTGREVEAIDPAARELRLRDGAVLRYAILIGADGVNSLVARSLFGRAFDPRTVGFALEIEQPEPAGPEVGPVRIDFGAAEWGYGWSFPKRLTRTIGVGGLHHRNPDMKARMADYVRDLGIAGPAPKVKGHFVPFGDVRRRLGRGRILLAGDAAGLVDPVTGEGIAYAIRSGHRAADCAHRALTQGAPEAALGLYRREIAGIRRSIAWARALRGLVYSTRLSGAFERLVGTSTSPKSGYLDLLAGEIEYPALIWRKLRQWPVRALDRKTRTPRPPADPLGPWSG